MKEQWVWNITAKPLECPTVWWWLIQVLCRLNGHKRLWLEWQHFEFHGRGHMAICPCGGMGEAKFEFDRQINVPLRGGA
jgi:hypothetical protein